MHHPARLARPSTKVICGLIASLALAAPAQAATVDTVIDSVTNSAGQPAPIVDNDGDGFETVVIRFHATGTLKPTQLVYSCSRDGGASLSCSSPYSFRFPLGTHNFSVAARSKKGDVVDATPAKVSFDVVSAPKPPPPPPPPPAECSDGADNDADGLIDYPVDLGCLSPDDTTESPNPGGITYKFDDEFDGLAGSAPDPTKWQEVFGGSSPPRWGIECFVDDRDHLALDGLGNLVLTATAAASTPCTADGGGPGILSGGMETSTRSGAGFKFQYGVVEARLALECQQGAWPAFWTSGGTPTVSWPTDGEMDVGEGTPQQTWVSMNQALHMPGGQLQAVTAGQWCDTGFHTYTARWEAGRITFLIDGQQTGTYGAVDAEAKGYTWPFDTAGYTQRVIVDLQMGGAVGAVDTSTLPATMKVDYIRVAAL
jgi:hypothetical protein